MTAIPTRLVPALIRGQQIYVECPDWCTIDHVDHAEGFLEDLWHCGDYTDLMAPRMGKEPELALFARLGTDPYAPEAARRKGFVTVDDGGEGYYMAPDQAEQFANNLEAFAEKIREMARTARGEA